MHYIGYVIVDEPTEAKVAEAMEDHKGTDWDWYRCGGRWDGYLLGDEEMKKRATHNGFNFDDANNCAERNSCKVSELSPDKPLPYFFVADYDFVPREHYDRFAKSDLGLGYGAIVETPDYEERFRAALAKHADKFIVVVDAHN
jgi:hypothetical protein